MRAIGLIALGGLIVAATVSRAGVLLEIAPGVVEVSAPAGRSHKGFIKVRNATSNKVRVDISIRDTWTEYSGLATAPSDTWLTLKTKKPFVLAPGRFKKVPYRVTLPKDFSGETMAMILFTGPSTSESGTGTRFRQGIPIYATARGTERRIAAVSSLNVFHKKNNLEFEVGVENKGNVHVRPAGVVRVIDASGAEVWTAPLSYGTPVFPTKKGIYYATASFPALAPADYTVRVLVTDGMDGRPPVLAEIEFLIQADAGGVIAKKETPSP